MATEAQIAANRRNAQKSTGPKTDEGKAASRQNALRHGLTAVIVTLPHENADEFDALHQRLLADHKPASETESILIAEIAQASLMLQRAARYEASLFDVQIRQLKLEKGRRDEPAADDDMAIAINFCLPKNQKAYSTMFRYIARAEAKLHRAIDRLRALQNDRLRREREAEKQAQVTEPKTRVASFGSGASLSTGETAVPVSGSPDTRLVTRATVLARRVPRVAVLRPVRP